MENLTKIFGWILAVCFALTVCSKVISCTVVNVSNSVEQIKQGSAE